MRAGPCASIVEKGNQPDPIAISQGMSQPAGLAKDARRVCEVGAARWHLLSGDGPGTCLDLPHLVGLELWGAVVVNETNTAHQLGWKGSVVRARRPPLLTLHTRPLIPIPPDAMQAPSQVPDSQP